MKNFPWDMFIYSMLIAAILRPVFTDNLEYMMACGCGGIILGLVYAALEGNL